MCNYQMFIFVRAGDIDKVQRACKDKWNECFIIFFHVDQIESRSQYFSVNELNSWIKIANLLGNKSYSCDRIIRR